MISAKKALETFSESLEQEYKRAEGIIDLQIGLMASDEVVANLGGISSSRVLERLREAYTAGGWSVTIQPADQRDGGPFFRLRVDSPTRSGF